MHNENAGGVEIGVSDNTTPLSITRLGETSGTEVSEGAAVMKSTGILTGAVLALLVGANNARAEGLVDLSQMQSAGTGCKAARSLEAYHSTSSGRLLVFFQEMKVDVVSKTLDRKACAISLPVSLPANQRMVLTQPSVFGFSALASGASASAQIEIFETGGQGPTAEQNLEGLDASEEFYYERGNGEYRTACGAQTILRANLSLIAKKGSSSVGGEATVEGAAVTLKIEDCVEAGPTVVE